MNCYICYVWTVKFFVWHVCDVINTVTVWIVNCFMKCVSCVVIPCCMNCLFMCCFTCCLHVALNVHEHSLLYVYAWYSLCDQLQFNFVCELSYFHRSCNGHNLLRFDSQKRHWLCVYILVTCAIWNIPGHCCYYVLLLMLIDCLAYRDFMFTLYKDNFFVVNSVFS